MQQQNKGLDQGPDFHDYMDAIIRRKALILAIFIVSIAATAAISHIAPRSYEVSMLIEPPVIGINNFGSPIFADSPINIEARIDAGAFDSNIIKALGLNPGKSEVRVIMSQPKGSTFLKIGFDKPENKKELGIRILNQLLSEMNNYYKSVIELKRDDADKRISVISSRIKNADNLIKLNEGNLKIIETRERELTNEIKGIKSNTKQLLIQRNTFLEKKPPADDISSLLYINTVQQNMDYFNQLSNQLAEARTKKEDMANAIKTLQNKINDSGMKMEGLKAAKENIRNISLVKEPQVSFEPIGLGRRKSVFYAGIISLMAGMFLAFFMESLKKTKRPSS